LNQAQEMQVFIVYDFQSRVEPYPDVRLYTPNEGFVKKEK